MVKVFNYLDDNREDVRLLVSGACASAERREDFRGIDLRYFEISCFKKGTVHIKFTNKRLLDKFNIFAAQRKKWLPPSYGKKAYDAMDAEERAVVDEFQGREAYEEVVKDAAFYIVEPETLLRLAGDDEAAPVVNESRQLAPAPDAQEPAEAPAHQDAEPESAEPKPVEVQEARPLRQFDSGRAKQQGFCFEDESEAVAA
jgi:hypothetical protein